MLEFIPLHSISAEALERLLDEAAALRTRQSEVREQIRAWAGQPDALVLAEYAAQGLPAEVLSWLTRHQELERLRQQLRQRQSELQASQEVARLSEQLEQANADMQREMQHLRALLPISRQLLQAKAQARAIETKLNASHGFGKFWDALSGQRSALHKELDWVNNQLRRLNHEFAELQQQHSLTLTAEEVQPHHEQRLKTWSEVLAALQGDLAAQQKSHDAALAQLAQEEREWQLAQDTQQQTWRSFKRYSLPERPADWSALWEKRAIGNELWQEYQALTADLQAKQGELEEQWRAWPHESQHEQAARDLLRAWRQRPPEPLESHAGPAPLLPWVGQAVTFEVAVPAVVVTAAETESPVSPLLPWLEPKNFRAVLRESAPSKGNADDSALPQPPFALADEANEPARTPEAVQSQTGGFAEPTCQVSPEIDTEMWEAALPPLLPDAYLTARPEDVSLTQEAGNAELQEGSFSPYFPSPQGPVFEEPSFTQPVSPEQVDALALVEPPFTSVTDDVPSTPFPLLPPLAQESVTVEVIEQTTDAFPLLPFPPAEQSVEPEQVDLNGTLPWVGTLPDQFNVADTAALFEQASPAALTPEERTRQVAVKVAVATGRQQQVNFIEDRLVGGLQPLKKVPRLERQLSTLSEAEIILVEDLYAWWQEQPHYGATYRMRGGEWQRGAANISRRTCEQLVGRYSSTPCFEEIIQLLGELHEHLGNNRLPFAYRIQTILDELPDDVDFETWANWVMAAPPLQDGEDWADEINFRDLLREL